MRNGINGLILSGGRSKRMGSDKGAIQYRDGMAHREYSAHLIKPFCEKTYISCRHDQQFDTSFDLIIDRMEDIGPLAGILSAFEESNDIAWLTVACDFPNLDTATVEALITNRDSNSIATCFFNEERNCPEPLITIWEPQAYKILKDRVKNGILSPLKILKEGNVALIRIPDMSKLINVNNPDQKAQLQ